MGTSLLYTPHYTVHITRGWHRFGAMINYFKLSGGGNDFIALVDPEAVPRAEQIQAWCRRGVSLGADGVLVLNRVGGDIEMRHFNSDGSPSKLCLNGTRCAAQLAQHVGWVSTRFRMVTGAGPILARSLDGERVALELNAPKHAIQATSLSCGGRAIEGFYFDVGVPHFVIPWAEPLEDAPVEELGSLVRRHSRFEQGTNVDFVAFSGMDELEIRTYERGVEAETLACGTGVLAAAVTGLELGHCRLPVVAKTRGGFELELAEAEEGRWAMTGDARVVVSGTLFPGAEPGLRSEL